MIFFSGYFTDSYVLIHFLSFIIFAGVFLTNPLQVCPFSVIHEQLCSPSELLVRRQDVVSRWSPHTDLSPLARARDERWMDLNVMGKNS